jgi:hypothetical protein
MPRVNPRRGEFAKSAAVEQDIDGITIAVTALYHYSATAQSMNPLRRLPHILP